MSPSSSCDIAAGFAPLLDAGEERAAMVTWEHLDAAGTRLGINLLTAPPAVLDYLCRGTVARRD